MDRAPGNKKKHVKKGERTTMKKRFVKQAAVLAAAVMMTVGMATTAMAAQWKQDAKGWWWQNDDGKGQILRPTPNTAPLICGACYNTQPEDLLTMA